MALTTILVVDDDETVHLLIAANLPNYCLVHTYNGHQALRALGRELIDVVILDLNLPDRNGFQLLDEIRRDPYAPAVIMFSSDARPPLVTRAKAQGAYGLVEKTAESYRELDSWVLQACAWCGQLACSEEISPKRYQCFVV